MHCKFTEHGEEMEREDRVFRSSEVVKEASDKNETANSDSGGDKCYGVR